MCCLLMALMRMDIPLALQRRFLRLKHKSFKTKMKISQSNLEDKVVHKRLVIKSFCAWDGETLVLNILGTPSAKQDAIGKPKGNQLKVSVTAAPVAGRATDHMIRFLAKEFGVTINQGY